MQGKSEHHSAPVKQLRKLRGSCARDKDRLIPLVAETVAEGGSVLVFCGGRAQTQSGAGLVVDMLPNFVDQNVPEDVKERRMALVELMRSVLGEASNVALEKMILSGKTMPTNQVYQAILCSFNAYWGACRLQKSRQAYSMMRP